MGRAPHPPTSLIDSRSLREATRCLCDRGTRVVGWGTGSVFDYFQGLHPIPLDALVDSDSTRWGQLVGGVEVADPRILAGSDPSTTLVVIYSSYWPEIQDALGRIAPIPSLPASVIFADATVRARLERAERLASRIQPRRPRSTANAIVVQGPIVPGVTERVLQTTAALHPDDVIVLSTWMDTDPEHLGAVAALADSVVTSQKPEPAGIQNRNCQIVSTRAGVEHAIDLGAQTVLKTRTDLAVLADHVFERARWWLDRVGSGPARAAGLQERLIVPSSFTRKYLLYHPADLVMLGSATDMLTYWSAPLDPRTGTLLSMPWVDRPLTSVNLEGNPAECYLGVQLCRAIGRPTPGTLEDSWAFYRDLFVVVDNDWFDLLWFKNLSIPDAAVRQGVRQTVSQAFWERLQTQEPASIPDLAEVDPDQVLLGALMGVTS